MNEFIGFKYLFVEVIPGRPDHCVAAFGKNAPTQYAELPALAAKLAEERGVEIKIVEVPDAAPSKYAYTGK